MEYSFDELLDRLKHEDVWAHSQAALKIGKFRNEAAVEPLLTLMRNDNALSIFAAASSLKEIGSPLSIEPLMEIAEGRNYAPYARYHAKLLLAALQSE